MTKQEFINEAKKVGYSDGAIEFFLSNNMAFSQFLISLAVWLFNHEIFYSTFANEVRKQLKDVYKLETDNFYFEDGPLF